MKKIICVALIILVAVILLFRKTDNNIIYSWKMENISKNDFINNLKNKKIGTLYQEFSTKYLESNNNEILEKLSQNNIKTFQLVGDPSWGANKTNSMNKEIDKVIHYNKSNKYKIEGIVFDVEPYLENKNFDFSLYVDNMIKTYKYSKKNKLYMVITIPYWLDSKDKKLLEKLIKSGCDEISVMNYNIKKTKENIKTEVLYAKKYNKKINTIYEIKFNNDKYFKNYTAIDNDFNIINKYYNNYLNKAYHHYNSMYK